MLLIVVVLVALLTLGAYTFAELMVVETRAAAMFGREAQARAAADSGIDLITGLVVNRLQENPESYYHNPEWFQGILVRDASNARGRARFSVLVAAEFDQTGRTIRFGLADESSKLNINDILQWGLRDAQARLVFQWLPGMTQDIADAILDFIDPDEITREFGAENEYYGQFGYGAKNGPLESLDELLLVRGVTPYLLYGEDANRNGLLDANENDGDASSPVDNADGVLFRGWSAYLTVHGREINLRSDGQPKTNVNMNALGDLYDQLAAEFNEDVAKFVVAYRMSGPYTPPSSDSTNVASNNSSSGGTGGGGTGGGGTGGTGGGGTGGGSSAGGSQSRGGTGTGGSSGLASGSARGGSTTISPQNVGGLSGAGVQVVTAQNAGRGVGNSAQIVRPQNVGGQGGQQANVSAGVQQAAASVSNAMFGAAGQVTRGGIDLTAGGRYQVNSLYDLIGVQTQVTINGTQTLLDSPWAADASSMRGYLHNLFDKLSPRADSQISGRVNINQAPREVLLGVPGMTEMLADSIVGAQVSRMGISPSAGQVSERATTGWLYMEGLTDLPTLRQLDRYLTARGDVFRAQSVGYFDEGGPSARVEAIIDATKDPPQVVFQRDLGDLGIGYSPQLLTTGSAPGN